MMQADSPAAVMERWDRYYADLAKINANAEAEKDALARKALGLPASKRKLYLADVVRAEAKRKRAEQKAERKAERERIKEMEKLGYECTGTAPDGKLTWRKVKTWHEETAVQNCAGGLSETSGSSLGPSKAALASAQRALRNAKKLKSSSAIGSAREAPEAGRVIPLKS